MSDERPANWSPKYSARRQIWEQDPERAAELSRLRAGLPADAGKLTPAERIEAARATVRSLTLLLQAVDAGDIVATPLETARIQGAVEALRTMVGRATEEET